MEPNISKFQILSLSGGGVRGLYTISVLATIEQSLADRHNRDDYNIAKHFDLISGTSIGGILALGLASGLNARHLCSLIDKNREKIFYKSRLRKMPFLSGFFGACKQSTTALYDNMALKAVLEEALGSKKVSDLNTRVIIPAVNGTTGLPKIYKTSHHPKFDIDHKLHLVDVGMATSAAPTYFNPYLVDDRLMLDGGLIANSPSLIAYHEATHFLGKKPNDISLLCVGTMGVQATLNSDRRINRWGYLTGWGVGRRLLDLTLSSNEGMHNLITKQLLDDRFVELDEPNTPDQSKSITLDNANKKAAQMLKGRGKDKGQYALGMDNVMAFFEHIPGSVTFHKGGKPYEIQRS